MELCLLICGMAQKMRDDAPQNKKLPKRNPNVSPLKKLLQTKDVLIMLYPKNKFGNFYSNIESEDERTVYNLVKNKTKVKKSLLILLDTGGGNVYTAVKIMDCLRTKYDDIAISIPQEAKSSGTMMCFGADKLIMSGISELGPLDKPLPHPDYENEYISALDIVRSIDGTLDNASIRLKELGHEIKNEFGLKIQTSLNIACEHLSKLMSPMLIKENVKTYNQAKRLLAIAERYGSELLGKYMLKYIKNPRFKKRVINYIIRQFVWLYPDHAFAVRREELKDSFFIVEDTEKFDYWDELYKEFENNIGTSVKNIKFL